MLRTNSFGFADIKRLTNSNESMMTMAKMMSRMIMRPPLPSAGAAGSRKRILQALSMPRPNCGHIAVRHKGHVDYLDHGHLQHMDDGGINEHVVEVTATNPDCCTREHLTSGHDAAHKHGPGCGHEAVPHGDHMDYLVNGRLHHQHGDHCDDHGLLPVISC
jgi:hypothetical protein